MNVVTEYKVVNALGVEEINAKVNILIAEGWQPIGGISFSNTLSPDREVITFWAYQAMVR